VAELRNEFSWSKSRDDTFRTCPRQYYYQYYGAWGGWNERADPRARTLYILKQLQSRQQWLGTTVHNCLRWVLATLRKTGHPPAEELALQNLGRRLQVDFQNSGEGLYWEKPKETCALLEHEYDDLDVPDGAWQEIFEKALRCVSAFYQGPVLRDLLDVPRDQWLELEQLASFKVDDLKVWVQLDFAHQRNDGIRIFDWKTGKADTGGARDQLALYVLYAAQHWQVEPDRVTAVEFNLNNGEFFEHTADAEQLEAVRQRVRASAVGMKALLDDAALNQASEARFALTEDEKTCRRCPFRRVCPKWAPSPAE
jgi:CRISPR/Cas system-associated exonuclease Cas4 (RecB family)